MNIKERFISLVTISSNSDEYSETVPSTTKQLNVCNEIIRQLSEGGFSDIRHEGNGYVYARLPGNTDKKCPVIGFIAHVDTSPDMSDESISPRIFKYEGGDVVLNKELGIVMKEADYPALKEYIGDDLIVTDGTTLLGADDKAGVTEIIDALINLKNSGKEHGEILIGFTPDEEIGRGADLFDVPNFKADYAYTVDGGGLGEIEYENFNAASAVINITGDSIHPGSAKNKMINASQVAFELNSLLPAWERPEHTENYEGFFHLTSITGGVESATVKYIIRDHDKALFEDKKQRMANAVEFINAKYGKKVCDCVIKDSYFNMRELIEPSYYIVERIAEAMKDCGVEPIIIPIRGGTDGARLSYMGLLCPNICTGGQNFHGKYEFISVEKLEKVSEIIGRICTNAVGK